MALSCQDLNNWLPAGGVLSGGVITEGKVRTLAPAFAL